MSPADVPDTVRAVGPHWVDAQFACPVCEVPIKRDHDFVEQISGAWAPEDSDRFYLCDCGALVETPDFEVRVHASNGASR